MRKRAHQILFYLNDSELDSLTGKIVRTGLSREAYIRKVLCDSVPKELPDSNFKDLLYQLRMIGNNIHQIAVKANSLHFIDAPEYRKNYEEIQSVIGKIIEVIY